MNRCMMCDSATFSCHVARAAFPHWLSDFSRRCLISMAFCREGVFSAPKWNWLLPNKSVCPVYARATQRHFLLFGVVFSSPNQQCKGVFLFLSASRPPSAVTSFSKKKPCVGVSSSVFCSPSAASGSRNRMVRGDFRKAVVAKHLAMYSPAGKSVVFFVSLFAGAETFRKSVFARSAPYSSHFAPMSCKTASRPGSGALKTRIWFHTIFVPSLFQNVFAGAIRNSSRPNLTAPSKVTSQKRFRPNMSSSFRKPPSHSRRIFRKLFVAQTETQWGSPAGPASSKTTRYLSSFSRKPRTSLFLSVSRAESFCVSFSRVRRTFVRRTFVRISLLFVSILSFVSA